NVVAEAKDLKPFTVKLLRCTVPRRSKRLFLPQGTPRQRDARRTPGSEYRRAQSYQACWLVRNGTGGPMPPPAFRSAPARGTGAVRRLGLRPADHFRPAAERPRTPRCVLWHATG